MHGWGYRRWFYTLTTPVALAILAAAFLYGPPWERWNMLTWLPAALFLGLWVVGLLDMTQHRRAVLRNFPVIGHFRYLFESIRPEINQYFVESETDGRPFSRELRSIAYQRAKGALDTRPFGTILDLTVEGAEWMAHSIAARPPAPPPRIPVGAGRCAKPYEASLLNVSAMSYGALSRNAVLALNGGARKGGFYHNTGEGGLSPHHLAPGGDLVWQLGTGYFGARSPDGRFDGGMFRERASAPQVRMIEVKLSQGAKPGHGGILPAAKVTAEIASIRGVPMGRDVVSPPAHTAFSTPTGLLEFVARLRELSGGKPVGFKLCVGRRDEFLGICKAMLATGLRPDFITVDGAEGGTGAAPLEFSNFVGVPLSEGLSFVDNALRGIGVRGEVRVVASGRIITGFDMARRLALGADFCNSARGMMFSLGCIQALRCNSNACPTGVATQHPDLVAGLDVGDKTERVYRFHRHTVEALMDLLGASGHEHPSSLRPHHIFRRVGDSRVLHYGEIHPRIEEGCLAAGAAPAGFREAWEQASADRF
ncbi:MAG: FMN-binding glutamate synthase family protein [Planctomycetes bacterium]|nr:FMN-binding glutamate synthase family protein [Planctomycetota bacterium]